MPASVAAHEHRVLDRKRIGISGKNRAGGSASEALGVSASSRSTRQCFEPGVAQFTHRRQRPSGVTTSAGRSSDIAPKRSLASWARSRVDAVVGTGDDVGVATRSSGAAQAVREPHGVRGHHNARRAGHAPRSELGGATTVSPRP